MRIPGEPLPFDAVQFHFHIGSDHAIAGRLFAGDMHLVHQQVGGHYYAVLGMFVEPDSDATSFKFGDLIDRFESAANEVKVACGMQNASKTTMSDAGFAINPYQLLPPSASIYQYDGSLTTPPCTETVYWNVADTPISITPHEYLALTSLILNYVDPDTCKAATVAAPNGYTSRPLQAINGRTITRQCFTTASSSTSTSGQATTTSMQSASSSLDVANRTETSSSASSLGSLAVVGLMTGVATMLL